MLAPNYDVFNHYDGNLGIGWEDPISNPNRIDWNSIIQQGFAVGSQAINAWSGQNGGVQVGYNPAQGGVFAIQSNQPNQPVYQDPRVNMTPQQLQAYNNSIGGGVGSGIDGALNWVTQNPLLVGGVALGAYLLFKDPPRSRR